MRHYSNTFQDRVRQDAMNLLLGHYRPASAFKDDVFLYLMPQPEPGLFSRFVLYLKGIRVKPQSIIIDFFQIRKISENQKIT